ALLPRPHRRGVLDREPARPAGFSASDRGGGSHRRAGGGADMPVPIMVRIGALVVATTAFYAYVGQMVPQKEVQPPAEIVLKSDLTTADMVKVGREIMESKGLCLTCHRIGKSGG